MTYFKIGRGIIQIWKHCFHVCAQSCPTLWDATVAHQPPLSMGFPREELLAWVTIPFSKGASCPRDRTHVSESPALVGGFFTIESPGSLRPIDYLQGAKFFPDICSSLCYTLSLQGENRTCSQEDTLYLGRPACKQETQLPSISSQSITQQLGHAVMDGLLILADVVLLSRAEHPVLMYSVHILQKQQQPYFSSSMHDIPSERLC